MSLITVNLPVDMAHALLGLLERLVVAVERIAGPPPAVYNPLPPSTLKDYAVVSPDDVQRVQEAEMEFGLGHMLVPGSPAFLAAIAAFEKQVAEAYGEDAVASLPWKVQTGIPPQMENQNNG